MFGLSLRLPLEPGENGAVRLGAGHFWECSPGAQPCISWFSSYFFLQDCPEGCLELSILFFRLHCKLLWRFIPLTTQPPLTTPPHGCWLSVHEEVRWTSNSVTRPSDVPCLEVLHGASCWRWPVFNNSFLHSQYSNIARRRGLCANIARTVRRGCAAGGPLDDSWSVARANGCWWLVMTHGQWLVVITGQF